MSTSDQYWALPDGISEALPDEAWRLENLRRELLDLYLTWGYRQVMPPLVEYMQSLSTGLGSHLDVQTFKVTDQLSGRMMGIRADMTPQVARIDAHKLKTAHPNRLCYIGTVLRTRAFNQDGSRAPLQVGAELFGHAGLGSDLEVISLLLNTLNHCNVPDITLDIGHVNIFRSLSREAGFSPNQERELYDLLERKALPDISYWLNQQSNLSAKSKHHLAQLPYLYGSIEVIDKAKAAFAEAGEAIRESLNYLSDLLARLQQDFPDCHLHVDLTELSGYDYHTGVIYAAYTPGCGQEIARGGRYDGVGKLFGRDRPATGFSTDLRLLNRYYRNAPALPLSIWVPYHQDPKLATKVAKLRRQGYCLIRQLDNDASQSSPDAACEQRLDLIDGEWQQVTVSSENEN